MPDCLRLAQALRRAMGYWVDEHVVREEGSGDQLRYVVVDDPSAAEAAAAGAGNEAASCPSVAGCELSPRWVWYQVRRAAGEWQ